MTLETTQLNEYSPDELLVEYFDKQREKTVPITDCGQVEVKGDNDRTCVIKIGNL